MIRPYKITDNEKLIELFKLNTPKYFDIKEVLDFEKYLVQHAVIRHRGFSGKASILPRTNYCGEIEGHRLQSFTAATFGRYR